MLIASAQEQFEVQTLLEGGGLSASSSSSAEAAPPLGSSGALRFCPPEDLGFSCFSSPLSSVSLSTFFALGFAGFLTKGSGFGKSLIREDRRGSAGSDVAVVAVAAAFLGIVVMSVWKFLKRQEPGYENGGQEQRRVEISNRFQP